MNEITKDLFIESIKVSDGEFYNLPLHNERMNRTAKHFFSTDLSLSLSRDVIPAHLRRGLVKCRVLYNHAIVSVAFEPYSIRRIETLKLVDGEGIDYSYKSCDRVHLEQLRSQRGDADEILIVKNGFLTDTSYTNIVLERDKMLYTPSSCLLKGVKRESLLRSKAFEEIPIRTDELKEYTRIYLINAMIDLEDNVSVEIGNLIL